MAASSESYHEPYELLSEETKDMHRGLVSVMEELEAIDWYQQRADACQDPELKSILLHNKHEEIEHALMGLEWLRRRSEHFDAMARTYLFTDAPILEVEEADTGAAEAATPGGDAASSLGIGSLKGVE